MNIEYLRQDGVEGVTLENQAGLKVCFLERGASVYSIEFEGKPMTIAPAGIGAWAKTDGCFGRTLGRISGRIPNAVLPYHGKNYPLTANEGTTCLHGGKMGWGDRDFHMEVGTLGDETCVTFTLSSADGDGGFPGNVAARVRYLMPEDAARLTISYKVISDREAPVALTNHIYWNLGGASDVLDHELMIRASYVQRLDEKLIPHGFIPVYGPLDLRTPKLLKEVIPAAAALKDHYSPGYDDIFRFDHEEGKDDLRLRGNGFILHCRTNAPCVIVYSDNYPREGCLLSDGLYDVAHAGITSECAELPLDFESMSVRPGVPFRRQTVYEFERE